MSCSHVHSIEIINLSNGETLNHEILLIRGKVSKRCLDVSEVSVDISCGDGQLQLRDTRLSRNGEFKILCDLCDIPDSQLTLRVVYCNAETSVDLNYRRLKSPYRIQPLYIVGQGDRGDFLAKEGSTGDAQTACRLIDLNVRIVQSLYAEKLREMGFHRLTFTLNDRCQIFPASLTNDEIWQQSEDELWHSIGKEILNSSMGNDQRLKFVAFIACTRYEGGKVAASGDFSYANVRKHLKGHAALGGGGLALFGSSYFYSWPSNSADILKCFTDESRVDLSQFPDDSNYRRTHAGVYSSSLGSICHELGHIFDLGHTEDGIMGTGFDYLNRVFTVDNLTECLPRRQIHKGESDATVATTGPQRARFTQLKKQSDTFLDKYHEQKRGDSFYFTRSCAVILAFHRWIRSPEANVSQSADEALLTFDPATQTVACASTDALKLIEVRRKSNSLVESFYELSPHVDDKPVLRYALSSSVISLSSTHYLFVITASGCTKSIHFNEDSA